MIFGVDIHPRYQAGISIEQIHREGISFMACKVSEATAVYDSQAWLRRGKAAGMLCLGYHYLRPGNEVQQAHVFAEQLLRADVPGMLDAEALSSDGSTATLTVSGIRRFLDACRARGVRVPLLYLPRWYWQRMGSPQLSGLPPLWASSYPTTRSDIVSELYRSVTNDRWFAYGGLQTAVLQFSDRARVAGQQIDANAFRGTFAEFASLIGEDDMPTPAEVWNHPIEDPYVDAQGGQAVPKPAWVMLAWAATHAAYAKEQAITARAEIAALRLAVLKLAEESDLDADDLLARMDTKFREVLKDGLLNVEVTIQDRVDDNDSTV